MSRGQYLFQQQHAPDLHCLLAHQAIQVHPARHLLSGIILSIPLDLKNLRILVAGYQRAHGLAHYIVAHQGNLARRCDLISDPGAGIEWIGVVLGQGEAMGNG